MPQIKIDVRALSADDTNDLLRLDLNQDGAEVSYLMEIQESAESKSRLIEIILTYGTQVASAVAVALLAALKEKIKSWLLRKKQCGHRRIPIYGPNNEVVTVIECDEKHPGN
ncbi:MAG TPA: hypothetical protein VG759_24645 [Candidatus Angelobacter sp.]|jgi:hypothetical protein|nr:hypothetical protein [Candidatus Angelobacter sp.]